MEWPHSEILAHHTHQASGYETYCSSTNTITDAHNAGLQLRFPLPWPRLWLTFHLHEAFWVRDRACKEWDNWSFPSWLESVVAFPLNHTEFRFAALDFTGSSVRNKSLQVWWFTAALETEFLMTEWLIFSLEKQSFMHTCMPAEGLHWSYCHFLCNCLLCLVSFPSLYDLTHRAYIQKGTSADLKTFCVSRREQESFEQHPRWGRGNMDFLLFH